MQAYTRFFTILIFLLILKATFITYAIFYAGIGLGPDEAQYWTWSQQLDFGYYSKPPGIAWEIGAGTALFGNTEFGVRFMTLVLGTLFPIFVFFLAKNCRLSPVASFFAAISSSFAPLGIFASLLAITDTGMILAWTAASIYIAAKLEQKQSFNPLILGTIICIGALFKWTMFLMWIAVFGCWLFFPWMRNFKNLKQLTFGFLFSFLALLPSAYWNSQHEWATFRHVFSTLKGGHGSPVNGGCSGNPLEFIGSQIALVSPVLFALLVLAWGKLIRKRQEISPGVLFCGWLSLTLFLCGLIASFFMKMQGNWIIFTYPTAFVMIAYYSIAEAKSKMARNWLIAGCVLSCMLSFFVLALPTIQSKNLFSSPQIPYRVSPFRHNVGWDQINPVLKDFNYNPETDFLFSEKYQTSSILSFYGLEQKRAYFLNLSGARNNQFSYWPGMKEEQKGKKGYFVIIENIPHKIETGDLGVFESSIKEKYTELLKSFFKEVTYLGMKPLFVAYGKPVKNIFVFECDGYNGKLPQASGLY